MRNNRPQRRPSPLSLWGFVSLLIILIVILASFSYRSIRLEERLMLRSLKGEALSIIKAMEAGARTGILGLGFDESHVKTLVEGMAQEAGVAYLGIVDEGSGRVIVGSQSFDARPASERQPAPEEGEAIATRLAELDDGRKVFELTRPFRPLKGPQMHVELMAKLQERLSYEEARRLREAYFTRGQSHPRIILGLDTARFEEARANNRRQILLNGLTVFLFGLTTLYLFLTAQHYYVVKRTLSEMKGYTQSVVENIANGLISTDPAGKVVEFNKAAQEILRIEKGRAVGRPLGEILSFDRNPRLREIVESSRDRREEEIEFDTGQGVIPLSVGVTDFSDPDGGTPRGKILILRDIREVNRLKAEVERSSRLAALGRLAAGIAHEVRNPLNSLKGFAQFLHGGYSPGTDEHKYTSIMIGEVERLNKVVGDLLRFARTQEPRTRRVAVPSLLEESLALIQYDARQKGVQIEKSWSENIDLEIEVDPEQIKQVLLNLFLNALQAMPGGGVLTVTAAPEDDGVRPGSGEDDRGRVIVIGVEDTGCGMSKEELEKVFDPFYTTKKKGTGLGLAITHSTMENHRARIRVESEKGKGARVRLFFPAADSENGRGSWT